MCDYQRHVSKQRVIGQCFELQQGLLAAHLILGALAEGSDWDLSVCLAAPPALLEKVSVEPRELEGQKSQNKQTVNLQTSKQVHMN